MMRALVLGIILIVAPNLYAKEPMPVTAWTKKTLLNTLSVDYKTIDEEHMEYRAGFTMNAWNALKGFLGGYGQTIRDKELSIHPVFLIEPQVVDSGIAAGVHFARVNTEVLLPEINVKVAFSVIVIATKPPSSSPYLIQSISMVKEEK
ncbi:hypothetical protein [Legionella saoudiensis]|uniref:hypothetical protein n=1 Tax=Legionella saoudiensis TaxID=1750561 RepID=UPI000ACFFE20|nr:hypothetical protein [Legionella saoudiensis]